MKVLKSVRRSIAPQTPKFKEFEPTKIGIQPISGKKVDIQIKQGDIADFESVLTQIDIFDANIAKETDKGAYGLATYPDGGLYGHAQPVGSGNPAKFDMESNGYVRFSQDSTKKLEIVAVALKQHIKAGQTRVVRYFDSFNIFTDASGRNVIELLDQKSDYKFSLQVLPNNALQNPSLFYNNGQLNNHQLKLEG